MITNRKLKSTLLKELKVTPQRLSQRVKEVKNAHGPMSTEDATYVIAHEAGLDLTKFLSPGVVDRIRSLVPKASSGKQFTPVKKTQSKKSTQVTISIDSSLPKLTAFISTTIPTDAAKMAQLYPKYYIIENSIRIIIKRILENKYGSQWWQCKVPKKEVCFKVTDRKNKEKNQPWHGKRGQHEIFYSDFGDLKKIILHNWADFKNLFPTQAWIIQRLEDLETPRNIMAHHNPVSRRDLNRIDVYFEDLMDLLDSKQQLIP